MKWIYSRFPQAPHCVSPHVFKEDEEVRIKLLVQIEDGEIEQTLVKEIPRVRRSSINTQALIGAGESLLIGGMVKVATNEGVTKVPLLGDIPVLGNLFKSRNDRNEHTERLFLISPRLIPARRPVSGDAPIGPQRPGNAIAVPPLPEAEPQPESPKKPLATASMEENSYAPLGEF